MIVVPVPRLWPRATCFLIGGGPSLTAEDVALVRGQGGVIAINDAYRLAPWADVLYAADRKWIDWHHGVPSFTGPKYSIQSSETVNRPDWQVLRNTGIFDLELDPSGLRTGRNSGYQAINLAVHLGATRILLLGYDMSPDGAQQHWFGDHPDHQISPYAEMRAAFETLMQPLAALGISVVNCSRRTALTAFPCLPLEMALAQAKECAA